MQHLGDSLRQPVALEPTIEISTRCVNLIELIPNLQHDPNRPEDVLKMNADDEGENADDYYDACRYGIMQYQETRSDSGYNPGVPYKN